jgi:hypothetical protein
VKFLPQYGGLNPEETILFFNWESQKQEISMSSVKLQDQGINVLSQTGYLPILINSFPIDRKTDGFAHEIAQRLAGCNHRRISVFKLQLAHPLDKLFLKKTMNNLIGPPGRRSVFQCKLRCNINKYSDHYGVKFKITS